MNPFKKSSIVSTTFEVRQSKRDKDRNKQDRMDKNRRLKLKEKEDRAREKAAERDARRRAEEANLAKSRFFAAASHDLRQPLHALGLLAHSLRDRSALVREDAPVPG